MYRPSQLLVVAGKDAEGAGELGLNAATRGCEQRALPRALFDDTKVRLIVRTPQAPDYKRAIAGQCQTTRGITLEPPLLSSAGAAVGVPVRVGRDAR